MSIQPFSRRTAKIAFLFLCVKCAFGQQCILDLNIGSPHGASLPYVITRVELSSRGQTEGERGGTSKSIRIGGAQIVRFEEALLGKSVIVHLAEPLTDRVAGEQQQKRASQLQVEVILKSCKQRTTRIPDSTSAEGNGFWARGRFVGCGITRDSWLRIMSHRSSLPIDIWDGMVTPDGSFSARMPGAPGLYTLIVGRDNRTVGAAVVFVEPSTPDLGIVKFQTVCDSK